MIVPYFGPDDGVTLYHGDCRDVLPTIGEVDAVVSDPPYGFSFMGKEWDHGVPGETFWRSVLGAMKPGAHLLAFGGTRTHHRLMVGIEDAGFEIRDVMMWVYGSGFPKNMNIGKALDQEAGASREVIGMSDSGCYNGASSRWDDSRREKIEARKESQPFGAGRGSEGRFQVPVTAPATESAKKWDGWGTALKPAWEPIIVARKPLAGNTAQNVNAHGVGGLNIDGCRIPLREGESTEVKLHSTRDGYSRFRPGETIAGNQKMTGSVTDDWKKGRWPANLVHDGSDEVVAHFPDVDGRVGATTYASGTNAVYGKFGSGGGEPGFPDFGNASRFFYCAKASKADRDEGLEGMRELTVAEKKGQEENGQKSGDGSGTPIASGKNHHPTVKPLALMRYLVRLVTPVGGVVLDPFMGSGSTGKAADLEGCQFIGIDIDESFCELASKRRSRQRPLPML